MHPASLRLAVLRAGRLYVATMVWLASWLAWLFCGLLLLPVLIFGLPLAILTADRPAWRIKPQLERKEIR